MPLNDFTFVAALGLVACSDSMDSPPRPIPDAGVLDFGTPDQSSDEFLDSGSADLGSDLNDLDMIAETDQPEDLVDMDQDLQELDADVDTDAGTPDADMGSDADMEQDQDTWPPPYDETGWTMSTRTHADSASTGTPDSYFYEVDPGSPLSANISGSNGIWSVNVYGGMSNQLYCTGSSLCRVMLRPEDTIVVVTAITTNIGSYSLTVRYSGPGLM